MSDPRIDAVAEAIRDYEDGTTGWLNTTEAHKAYLRREAQRLLVAADAVDRVRIALGISPEATL